jgi:membrane protease subunit HflK
MAGESDNPITPQGSPTHRPASVMLRTEGERDGAAMDPANQSLAEALNLIFRLLQGAMILLVVAFVFSGFQSVNENQRGIKLLFGRKTEADLTPGFHFSAPFPLGEIVKVDTGNVALNLDEAFWPRLTAEQKTMSPVMTAKPNLKPGEDGSLVTGDESLVHTKWLVNYTRSAAAQYAENMLPEDERRIVEAAVERGVVQAVAQVKVDELLKQSASDQGSVAVRAREIAQRTLDSMSAGIKIEQLTLQDKVPPFNVINDFSLVQTAEQNASKRREEAQTTARNTLNSVAGAAHAVIIERIGAYEEALARNDVAARTRSWRRSTRSWRGARSRSGRRPSRPTWFRVRSPTS